MDKNSQPPHRQNQDAPQNDAQNKPMGGVEPHQPGEEFFTLPEDGPHQRSTEDNTVPPRGVAEPKSFLERETNGQQLEIKESDADRDIHPEDTRHGGLAQNAPLYDNNDRDTYAQ
jgi:hypothetical protein